ncbi:MAG TPA: L-threonylcarbamoyladenylate synthase [Burkholderiales bacterium]|nr:L-threonylcarbamoyladenylate synthase [Burkholderiales bacterium]
MSQFFSIHPENPQPRLVRQAAEILRAGGVMVYPTDSCYALGCQIGDKDAMERIRDIRGVDEKHHFTLVCRDVSEIAHYARVDNRQFRLLRSAFPGSYTFILEATKEVPRRLQHPKRRTIGVRIPDHPVALALLAELGEPILSSTLLLPGDEHPLNDADEIRERLGRRVELIIGSGSCGFEPTTVLDITGPETVVARQGRGDLGRLGLAA